MTGAVSGTKGSLSEVMDRTREAVQDSMEKTKTVVSGGVQTMMESRAVKLMSSRVDTALSTSETLLEQYLPEAEEVKGEDRWTLIGIILRIFELNWLALGLFLKDGIFSSLL